MVGMKDLDFIVESIVNQKK